MPEGVDKEARLKDIIRQASAEYFRRESSGPALITVTNIEVSRDNKRATVLISVYPETKEGAVIEFANRKRDDLREYVKKHTRLKRIPFFEIKIDLGEKNRQRLEEIEDL